MGVRDVFTVYLIGTLERDEGPFQNVLEVIGPLAGRTYRSISA